MAMQGNLRDMSVADIIQHNCQERKIALLTVEHNGKKAQIYFKNGAIVHAVMDTLVGEEVVFKALSWDDGRFILDAGISTPMVTIKRSWSSLLLEGAKRLDEYNQETAPQPTSKEEAGSKEEQIKSQLSGFLARAKFIKGLALVDLEGNVRAAQSQDPLDKEIFGAVASATLSHSKRSLTLTRQGKFSYTIMQGETGCLIVATVNTSTLLVGIASGRSNVKEMMDELAGIASSLVDLAG